MTKYIEMESLEPKEKMKPNERCWCQSGKKWKKCHKDRHLLERANPSEIEHQLRLILKEGEDCLHPDNSIGSCKATIDSHAIQKRGGLACIAENGHVISPKQGTLSYSKYHGEPQSLGISKASTFKGFCSYHDNQMFSLIEKKSIDIKLETAFLFAFRALAYEYTVKVNALKANEFLRTKCDLGLSFEEQVHLQQLLFARSQLYKHSTNKLNDVRSIYDKAFLNSKYDSFRYFSIQFDGIIPIVGSGAFNPEFNFSGDRLQNLLEEDCPLNVISLNITSFEKRSVVVFGCLADEEFSLGFIKSFMQIKDELKLSFIMYIAFEQLENIYFEPSWWNSLSTNQIEKIQQRLDRSELRKNTVYTENVDKVLDISIISNSDNIE